MIRFDPSSGEVDWEFGVEGVPGHDVMHLCLPTNVDTDGEGHVYISDGYCNARVLKVDIASRHVVKTYDVPKSYKASHVANPRVANNPFKIVHSIALSLCDNAVLAADRERG